MIKVYEPTENFLKKEKLSIFLAGGIANAPDWQKKAIEHLTTNHSSLDLAVFNPRRATPFSKEDYGSREDQVSWEFRHLRLASAIMFWFPENAPCTTSLFELGYWSNFSKVFVGVNPGHYKENSIKTQIRLLNESRIGVKIVVQETLEATIEQAIPFIKMCVK